MKHFRIAIVAALTYLVFFVNSENGNIFKNAQDQLEWLQFKAYWEAYYSGESVIEEAEFRKILEESEEKDMPSFRSMSISKKLLEFEKMIKNLDSSKTGPSPSQLAQLEKIQDLAAFGAESIYLTKGSEGIYMNYPRDLADKMEGNCEGKKSKYSKLLDNYIISYKSRYGKDTGPLSSFDKIKFTPSLKLLSKRSLFGFEFDRDLNLKVEKFLKAVLSLLDIQTFPEGIQGLEDLFKLNVGNGLRILEIDEVRHSIAIHLSQVGGPAKVWKFYSFFEKIVFGSALNAEKVFKEKLKDASDAEYEFCKLNVVDESWTYEEKRLMEPVMKFVTGYFAAKLALEVKSVKFEGLYDAINYGFKNGDCSYYKTGRCLLNNSNAGFTPTTTGFENYYVVYNLKDLKYFKV